jgi:hypothetical protein
MKEEKVKVEAARAWAGKRRKKRRKKRKNLGL